MTPVRIVRPHEVHAFWPRLQPLVEKALSRQRAMSRTSVHCALEDGRMLAFLAEPAECVLIVEIQKRPLERVLHIVGIGGKLPADWEDILQSVENWARAEGCSAVENQGRWGWRRKLRGYTTPHVLYRKELADA